MIFRLRLTGNALDAELGQVGAQARERPLVQEPGEIVGAVGQKLAAPEADEEVEILALDARGIGPAGRLGERGVGQSDRRSVAAQAAQPVQQPGIRSPRQKHREQRVFLRARGVDLVEVAAEAGMLGVKVGTQHRATDAGHGLDRQHALGRDARPVGYRRLGNANFPGKRADPAGDAYRFVQTLVPHRRAFLYYFS